MPFLEMRVESRLRVKALGALPTTPVCVKSVLIALGAKEDVGARRNVERVTKAGMIPSDVLPYRRHIQSHGDQAVGAIKVIGRTLGRIAGTRPC